MSLHTEVRVLRGDAPCNACAMQIERARATASVVEAVSPHGANFLLKRETFGGVLIITTACTRAVADELLAIEVAAYPAESVPVPG
jgi:hypothetical protein